MDRIADERQMIENQLISRHYNEQVGEGFKELERLALEEGHIDLIHLYNNPLFFYCECPDLACNKRLKLKPSTYNRIHERRDRFIVAHGHETPTIEKVLNTYKAYVVVQKTKSPMRRIKKSSAVEIT